MTVSPGFRSCRIDVDAALTNVRGEARSSTAVITATSSTAVPVANGWRLKVAPYARSYSVIHTARWSTGTAIVRAPIPITPKYDQPTITRPRSTHGPQAISVSRPVRTSGVASASGSAPRAAPTAAGTDGAATGVHARKSRTTAAIETSDATMSAACGPQR